MSKTDLAYMAGIFDGEGCIVIAKRKPRGVHELSCSYTLRTTIQITDRWICELFRFNFGGTTRMSKAAEGNNLAQWTWNISGIQADEMLKTLLPYLRLKRTQAELAFKFQARRHRGGYGQGGRKPPEVSAVEETQYLRMQSLKREKVNE